MTAAYFEDHPTDLDKVILRKPRHEDDDDVQDYKRPWVGLTNGEMIELSEMELGRWDLILEVEEKLRSKNA